MSDKIKTKNGFTLSEVLITLVIIGIVAALTIPSAISKYQKQQTISQLKKTFSDFSQALKLSVPKYGDPVTWDYSLGTEDFFNRYLKPNFVKATEKTLGTSEMTYLTSSGGYENKGGSGVLALRNGARVTVLNSGVIIYYQANSGIVVSELIKNKCYVVDLNGLKKPNRFGRDAFYLCVDGENGKIVPLAKNDSDVIAAPERTREELKNGGSVDPQHYHCNSTNGRGIWCAALIIRDGWQIKDDYPW